MSFWLVVAAIGGALSLWGLGILVRRYRRGEITGRTLVAVAVGYVSFVSFVVVSELRPDLATGPVTVVLLLPAFVAIVIVVRERESHR